MSCFGMATTTAARTTRRRGGAAVQPWRWWRQCAGLAAAIHSKISIRRRAVRWHVVPRRRRRSSSSSSSSSGWCQHRSFAPVYVDELYAHPTTHHVDVRLAPSAGKMPPRTDAGAGVPRAGAKNGAAAAYTYAATSAGAAAAAGARGSSNSGKAARVELDGGGAAAAAKRGGVRRSTAVAVSPMRGGGMGEVDLRAEVFIRKFREEMRLQSQQSADEFHAMLARGL